MMQNSMSFNIKVSQSKSVCKGRRYSLGFRRLGQADVDPKPKNNHLIEGLLVALVQLSYLILLFISMNF